MKSSAATDQSTTDSCSNSLSEIPQGPDVGSLDPTDGRGVNEWQSRYPKEAKTQIRQEAWFIFLTLVIALALIFATWQDAFAQLLSVPPTDGETLQKYAYYSFSGLLGGSVYGMKYLYRVVARGWWHEDRKLWRYMSPFIALALSFAIGALIEGKFMSVGTKTNAAALVGTGFLVGYFADQAIGKLHDIADVIFGPTGKKQSPPHHHH